MSSNTLELSVPKKVSADQKRRSYTFTLDPSALERIQAAATASNMSVSKFIETAALWYALDLSKGQFERLLPPGSMSGSSEGSSEISGDLTAKSEDE